MNTPTIPFSRKDQRGIALVLTLTILALVTILLIGFTVSMRVENMAAKNFNETVRARQLAMGAVDLAIYQIQQATPIPSYPTNYVTAPGVVFVQNGSKNWTRKPLYVAPDGTNWVDVNAGFSMTGIDLGGNISNGWIYVGVTNGAITNVTGRFTYFVDDDATKVNLNTAAARIPVNPLSDALGATPQDVDLSIFGVDGQTIHDSVTGSNKVPFATPNQWGAVVGASQITNQFYVTIASLDDNTTPWASPKINLNSLSQADAESIVGLDDYHLTNWFNSHTFREKYGAGGSRLKGIVANIRDFTQAPGINTGAQSPLLYGDSGEAASFWTGIPKNYLGLTKYPMLNEVDGQVVWWTQADGIGTNKLFVRLWLQCELINPYDQDINVAGGSIKVTLGRFAFWPKGSACPACGDTGITAQPDGGLFGHNYTAEVTLSGVVTNHSYRTFSLDITNSAPNCISCPLPPTDCLAGMTVDRANIQIDRVVLYQTQGNPRTIQDWAVSPDLPFPFVGAATNMLYWATTTVRKSVSVPPGAAAEPWLNQYMAGIAKNDPREKNYAVAGSPFRPAWYPVGAAPGAGYPAATPGSANTTVNYTSGTGYPNVPDNDFAYTATGVGNPDPAWEPSLNPIGMGSPYTTPGQLGYIHVPTLQWRTLMLQPQPSNEIVQGITMKNFIPDWVVLDIFGVSTSSVPGRVNINSLPVYGANGPQRVTSLKTLLTSSCIPAPPAAARQVIASNICNAVWAAYVGMWNPSIGRFIDWGTRRGTDYNFNPPPSATRFSFIGELCEIGGISNILSNEVGREARIRSMINLVTTHSDTFTVWAIAQALRVPGTNSNFRPELGDSITGEAKIQALVQRYVESGNVKFRTLYTRLIVE